MPAASSTSLNVPSPRPERTTYTDGAFAARSGAERSAPVSTIAIVIPAAARSTQSGTESRRAAVYCHS